MSNPVSSLGGSGAIDPLQARAAATPGTALNSLAGNSSSGGTTSTSKTDSNTSAIAGTDTFLKLLVAQLRNQDPTSPMDSQAFVTELAQFNTVEQMLSLKQAVNTQLSAQQATEGVAFIGKTVTYLTPTLGGGSPTTSQGLVTGVSLVGGGVHLQIGTQNVPLSEVSAVSG